MESPSEETEARGHYEDAAPAITVGSLTPSVIEEVTPDVEGTEDPAADVKQLSTNERAADHDVVAEAAKALEAETTGQLKTGPDTGQQELVPEVKITETPLEEQMLEVTKPVADIAASVPAGPDTPVTELGQSETKTVEDDPQMELSPRALRGSEVRQLPSVVGGLFRFGVNEAGVDERGPYMSGRKVKVYLDNADARQQLERILRSGDEDES